MASLRQGAHEGRSQPIHSAKQVSGAHDFVWWPIPVISPQGTVILSPQGTVIRSSQGTVVRMEPGSLGGGE